MTDWVDKIRTLGTDRAGFSSWTLFNMAPASSGATAGAGANLLMAMSLCSWELTTQEIAIVGPVFPAAGTGPYGSHRDMARFKFANAGGQITLINAMGPKATVFGVDGETVSPADSDVAAFITWILAHAKDTANGALVKFNGGNRWYFSE